MYPVLTLMIAAGLAFIPANIAKQKGHSFGLWWVYGWLLFIVAIIHVQFIEDYSAQTPGGRTMGVRPQLQKSPSDVSAELRSLKELLDSGIITQENFDRKKRQLLGL